MNWSRKKAEYGDIIRVKSGVFHHYGIYADDGEIIQFGLAPMLRLSVKESDIEVCTTDLEGFADGGEVEVGLYDEKELQEKRTPDETVKTARSRLGEKGYSILYNNCEHFAYECAFGKSYCSQTEDVRSFFRNIPIVDVYIAALPEKEPDGELCPAERESYVKETANELLKRQRYYVWKLLEYAVRRTFGKELSNLTVKKNESGKWCVGNYFVSLSHSDNALAVAVSKAPVGVDIENTSSVKNERLAEKILASDEYAEFLQLEEEYRAPYLLRKWTEKESIFKALNASAFAPKSLVAEGDIYTGKAELCSEEYIFSVCSDNIDKLRIYKNIKL